MKKTVSILLISAMLLTIWSSVSFALPEGQPADVKAQLLMGDVTGDNEVNTGDAVIILRWQAGIIALDETLERHADANMDGVNNTADATYILRIAAGMEEQLYSESSTAAKYNIFYLKGTNSDAQVPKNEKAEEGSVFTVYSGAVGDGTATFAGWKAAVAGDTSGTTVDGEVELVQTGRIYQVGDRFVMPSCDVVLTAQWSEGGEPTEEPTEEPTQAPVSNITVKYVDRLNELDVSQETIEGEHEIITAELLTVPEGYKLINESFSIYADEEVTVGVYPYEIKEGVEYRVIKNKNGFDNLSEDLSVNYLLTVDIDLGGELRVPFGWTGTSSSAQQMSFTGIFDGNGHRIDDLYLDYHGSNMSSAFKNVGLFAINEGVIKNLVLYTNPADGPNDYYYGVFGDENVGSVAGTNSGVISGCRVYGYVGSLDFFNANGGGVGGICGYNAGTIEKSCFEGMVDGLYWVGGLVGKHLGTMRECYFAGGVNATTPDSILTNYQVRYVGGLCGGAQNAEIRDCYTVCTSYLCAYRALGAMVGWYDGGILVNVFIVTPQLYYNAQYDSEVTYTVGYLPHGEASYPSEQSGLMGYWETSSDETQSLPTGYSAETWNMDSAFCNALPDLNNCRRGTSWFSPFDA